MTSSVMKPNKAPVDGSSKDGDLAVVQGLQLYGLRLSVSSTTKSASTENHLEHKLAAEITQRE